MTPPELVAHGGRIVLKLLGRPPLGTGHQFFQGADKRRPGQQRLHRLDVEQGGVIVAMLGIGGGAGQQHQARPARSQGLDGAVPGAAGGRLLGVQQLGQFLVLLPRLRRLPAELFQQVGPIVADQHGRAHRHGHDLVAPGGLVELQQLEDLAPLAALAAVALAGVALFTVAVVAGVGTGRFSGTAAISPRAASVPTMAEETMTPSASRDLAAARSFSVVLTTVKSEPVWACHSPRSRPAALASAGSSATKRRNVTPASGSAAGGVAGWESGRGQPAVASSKQPTAKPDCAGQGWISWQHGILYAAGGQRFTSWAVMDMLPGQRLRRYRFFLVLATIVAQVSDRPGSTVPHPERMKTP